ncbi:hypothetical protein AHAS_Ahas06G0109100 [Arachis hypogaea]
MEGSGKKVVAMKAQAYQLLLHLSSYFSDWETKGEKLKKMGLGVPALPFTFVAHLLAVAAIVMVLLWNIHFRGGLAWEATNKNLILNVCFLRRESTNVEDLFIAHIIGMDTMARGFKNAAKLIEESISQEKKRSHAGFVFKRLINTIVYFICCFLFYLVRSL